MIVSHPKLYEAHAESMQQLIKAVDAEIDAEKNEARQHHLENWHERMQNEKLCIYEILMKYI